MKYCIKTVFSRKSFSDDDVKTVFLILGIWPAKQPLLETEMSLTASFCTPCVFGGYDSQA